jgi:hypothetical protein
MNYLHYLMYSVNYKLKYIQWNVINVFEYNKSALSLVNTILCVKK